MAQVEKTVLVMHSCAQMFELVDAVEDYPQFLPWCGGSELHTRNADITHATIHINYHGIKQSFTTHNDKKHPEIMQIRLIDGPFKHLTGYWHFIELSPEACKIEFALDYAFANSLLEKMIAPVFHQIANTFVDHFVAQADKLYHKDRV